MHTHNLELFVLTVRDGFITASQERKSKVLLRSYFHIYDSNGFHVLVLLKY